jgi:K+:H+ antiporter
VHASGHLVFFLELVVLLVASRLLGEAFRALRQPAVVGELLAGVILGPSVLGAAAPGVEGWLFPAPSGRGLPPSLDAFASLAVTLLMLAAGLEVDLNQLGRQKRVTFLCALFGSVLPLVFGVAAGLAFAGNWGIPQGVPPFSFALVLGINLAMSALPVIAKTLMDLGIYRTPIGTVILSAAMLDDLGVWILFSLAMGLSHADPGAGGLGPWSVPLWTLLFTAGMWTVVRWMVRRLWPVIEERLSWPGATIALTVALGVAMGALTMWIGIHPVFGSFLTGVVIGSTPGLRPGTKDVIYGFVMSVFAPILFATLGLRVNLATSFDLALVAVVFFLGCAGKILGAGAGARMGGLGWRESAAVAVGLNARGIMGIVLGMVALEYGVIDERMFVALAILGVGTSLLSGPLLRWILGPAIPIQEKDVEPEVSSR